MDTAAVTMSRASWYEVKVSAVKASAQIYSTVVVTMGRAGNPCRCNRIPDRMQFLNNGNNNKNNDNNDNNNNNNTDADTDNDDNCNNNTNKNANNSSWHGERESPQLRT